VGAPSLEIVGVIRLAAVAFLYRAIIAVSVVTTCGTTIRISARSAAAKNAAHTIEMTAV
jgi:hypothetical protein